MSSLFGQSILLTEAEQDALRDSLGSYSRALAAGDSTVVRPLAALLDSQRLTIAHHFFGHDTLTVAQLAWRTLFQSTYLADLSWETPISGTTLKQYWQDTTREIVFAPLMGRFTDAPPGTREVRYQLQLAPAAIDKARLLRDYQTDIARAVADEDYFTPVRLIPEIGALGIPEAFAYLRECAAGQHWGKEDSPRELQVTEAIIGGLSNYRSLEAARLVLELAQRLEGWGHNHFVKSMAGITGIHLGGDWRADQDSLIAEYQQLLDSLPTLPELRAVGFQRADPARPEDFVSREAYLEHLITRPEQKSWVLRQALRELEELRTPRILVQLAAFPLLTSNYAAGDLLKEIRGRLENLTGLRLLVENRDGELVADGNDRVKSRNALYYWAKHYEDYSWSDTEGRFVYRGNDVAPLDTLAVLVERLYGKDDAAALNAMSTLMRLPLDTLERQLEGRCFTLLCGVNEALPFSLATRLLALAEVLEACRLLGYPTRLPATTKAVLDRLIAAVSEEDRRKLLSTLPLPTKATVTVLEAWGYVHARKYPKAAQALNERLREWYAERWEKMAIDGEDLRLFLLKSALRSRGSHELFWREFEGIIRAAGPEALAVVSGWLDGESDERIHREVKRILARAQVQSQDSFTVAEYLELGALGAIVPPERVRVGLTDAALAETFGRFEGGTPGQRYRLIELVDHHRDTAMMPFLLALASDTTTISQAYSSRRTDRGRFTDYFVIRQGDYMVGILEQLYGICFPITDAAGPPEEFIASARSSQALLRDKWRSAARWRDWLRDD